MYDERTIISLKDSQDAKLQAEFKIAQDRASFMPDLVPLFFEKMDISMIVKWRG